MKDLVSLDLRLELSGDPLFDRIARTLPDFKWRRGDSDAQGRYISGLSQDSVQIRFWLDEDPAEMSVSFSDVWPGAPDREDRKRRLLDDITKTLIPSIGSLLKLDA